MDQYIVFLILFISGFGSGIFVGMGSGTTGAIMITSLTVILNHSVHDAIGTTLLIDCIIGGIAGLIFLKKGNVRLKPAIWIIIIGAIGSFTGSRFTSTAPESNLLFLIGIILLLIGISFTVKGLQKNIDFVGSKIRADKLKKHKFSVFIIFGLITGFVSGFTGMGIGGVIALTLILILDYNLHTAIGTSLIMLFFISGSGATGHILNGEIIIQAAIFAGIETALRRI